MKLIVVKVERTKREKKEGISKATVRSFTRVFFEAADQTAITALFSADKKVHSVLCKLMPEALQRAGMHKEEKFSWNELAGSLKGGKPGFIMREDTGFAVTVTFGVEGTPLQQDVKETYTPSQIQDTLLASLEFKAGELLAA